MSKTDAMTYNSGAIVKVDRWNTGALRRYHIVGGAILVCGSKHAPRLLPVWCRHVHGTISRELAASLLRTWKAMPHANRDD